MNNQTSSRLHQGVQSVIHKISAWWQAWIRKPAILIFRRLKALARPVISLIIRVVRKVSPKVQLFIKRTTALIFRLLKALISPVVELIIRVVRKVSPKVQLFIKRTAALIFRLLKALISPVVEWVIRVIRKVSPKVQLFIKRTAAKILQWYEVRVVPILEPVVRVMRVIVDPLLKPIIKVIRKISVWWHALPRHKALLILDWLVVIAAVILMVVIYVPQRIWAEEETYRTESHRRMQIIQDAEELYNTVRGNYTIDGDFLSKLISQTHDSLIADTTFTGIQIVHVDGSPYRVNIPEFLGNQMDTTFSVGRQLRREVLDTTYTVTLWNDERAGYDTLYINGSSVLAKVKLDTAFTEVLGISYSSHSEVYTDYKWNRFRLVDPELLVCPVTREPFIISLDSTTIELTIASPIVDEYVESRYVVFKFRAKDHGAIFGGDPSWRRQ